PGVPARTRPASPGAQRGATAVGAAGSRSARLHLGQVTGLAGPALGLTMRAAIDVAVAVPFTAEISAAARPSQVAADVLERDAGAVGPQAGEHELAAVRLVAIAGRPGAGRQDASADGVVDAAGGLLRALERLHAERAERLRGHAG